MRFCMVTTFYPPYHFGGDATYVRALSRALVARGHSVEVVHCEDAYRVRGKEIDERVVPTIDEGVIVHRLKSALGILSPLITQQTGRPGLKSAALHGILDRAFDVVNFHNVSLIGGPGVLALSHAPVTLYTLHEHWLLCPTHIFWKNRSAACEVKQCVQCSLRSGIPPQLWRYTGLIERSVTHVDAFISPSEFTARLHRDAGIGPVQVLPLFSSLDPGVMADTAPLPRPGFLFVGRMTASKGVIPLIEQFAKLPQYDLTLVGEGDLRERLQREYSGYANIRFLGLIAQERLTGLYRAATALVFPSLAPETFGLSIAEAFACGTPAIIHDAGGSRELVEATGGGIVYRTNEELLEALRALSESPDLRSRLGRLARAGFERLYTQRRHVDAYLACVEDIRRAKG